MFRSIFFASCPVDPTFQWHSDNGQTQKSRFSVRMFYMPDRKPFYIHCRANVCGPNENCVEVMHCSFFRLTQWRSLPLA